MSQNQTRLCHRSILGHACSVASIVWVRVMAHVKADALCPVPALTLYASGAHLGIILTCYQVSSCLMTLEAVQQSACACISPEAGGGVWD